MCAAGLCQGGALPALLQSDFHVEAKVKQQWNLCNSVVASNMLQHLNNGAGEAFHPFTVLAGE